MRILQLLINMSREVANITNELILIISKAPIEDYANLKSLVYKDLILCDKLTYSDDISLNELAQNNYEFLDTAKAVLVRFLNYEQSPVSQEKLNALLSRIDNLLESLNSLPLLLPLSNGLSQQNRSNEDDTVPVMASFISYIMV